MRKQAAAVMLAAGLAVTGCAHQSHDQLQAIAHMSDPAKRAAAIDSLPDDRQVMVVLTFETAQQRSEDIAARYEHEWAAAENRVERILSDGVPAGMPVSR
jgi:hypothetical protein